MNFVANIIKKYMQTDTSNKMEANPREDVLPHESQTLNPKESEHKDLQVSVEVSEQTEINTVLDVCGETENQTTDSCSFKYSRSVTHQEIEFDVSHELSFESDISIKNKNLIGLIDQSKKRPSSLSSLCDRINLLNLEDEDTFENNLEENINTTENKHEDIEEYFPAPTIKSEESSEEFLPAVSIIKSDEICVTNTEGNVTDNIEESEQLTPAFSKINLDKDNIDNSAQEYIPINLCINDTGTDKSVEESVVKSDKSNELLTEKTKHTDDVKDQLANVCVESKVDIKTANFFEDNKSVSKSSDSVEKLNETILFNKSGDELLDIQTENIGTTSPGLSIKFNSVKTSPKETSEYNSTKTPKTSPAKLFEISVTASPNELDKTTSCINEDILNDSSGEPIPSGLETDNIHSIFVPDSDTNITFTESNDNTTPIKIETECSKTSFDIDTKNISISGFIKAADISECISTKDTLKSPKVSSVSEITGIEENTKNTQIVTISKSTSTAVPDILSISQSTDTQDLVKSPKKVVAVSQSTNTDENLNTEYKDKQFGPDRNSNFKMSDMVEKLSQQQAEISDLKLKLNAAQQHNASLELQIRQNEEIVIKTQAEALRTEQTYQQELKQLKQKINENSKIIEKDRIGELEEQLKEAKAKEAKLLAELSQRTKDDVNYQKIMDQYEITLKNRVSETKKLQEENETIRTHLTNLELAFSDVHSKYEKTKASLQGVKANEESLLHDLELAQSTNIQHEERYESLKAHARTQIEKSNKEIHDVKEQHEMEISKLRAFVRRLEIKVSSLEVSLQQKTAECEQLSALCDEVTGKKV